MLLDSVVGQMDEYIVLLIKVKLVTRHANVALFEEVALVFWGDQHPQSDIELALVDQQWLLYVLLDDKDIAIIAFSEARINGIVNDTMQGS